MDKQLFLKKLSINRPSVFESYNYDLLPVTFKASDKIPIECIHHGIFYQTAVTHLQKTGCPECGKIQCANNRALTTDEFIEKAKTKFGNKYDYSKTVYTRKGNPLTITCPVHHDFEIRPEAHLWSRHGCPKCDFEIPRAIKKKKVLEKANKIHNRKYDYSKVCYVNVNDPVEIVCPTHGSFWQTLCIHTSSGSGCPKCARENDKLTTEQFIERSKLVHGNRYNYSKVQYHTNVSMVTITCPEHGDFVQRAGSHLAGSKCKKCFLEENRKSTEQFIEDAKRLHGDKYDYSRVKYHGNKKPVEIVCPTHGSFWQKPNSHLTSRNGCRFCMESKGERAIEMLLKKYQINHIREYRLVPYLYRYDFYLPDLNIYIEFNGLQHYKPVDMFGGEAAFWKVKENDKIKKELVKASDSHLIILSYLHLNDDSVEKELIARFKQIYQYWFVIDGRLRVFKSALDLYKEFNIPPRTPIKDLVTEVKKIVNDFRILF